MHHLYATIIHLKGDHIVYGVSLVEINLIIQTIQDHQLFPSLDLFLNTNISDAKKGT